MAFTKAINDFFGKLKSAFGFGSVKATDVADLMKRPDFWARGSQPQADESVEDRGSV